MCHVLCSAHAPHHAVLRAALFHYVDGRRCCTATDSAVVLLCCSPLLRLQMPEAQLAAAVAPHAVPWLCQQRLRAPLEVCMLLLGVCTAACTAVAAAAAHTMQAAGLLTMDFPIGPAVTVHLPCSLVTAHLPHDHLLFHRSYSPPSWAKRCSTLCWVPVIKSWLSRCGMTRMVSQG